MHAKLEAMVLRARRGTHQGRAVDCPARMQGRAAAIVRNARKHAATVFIRAMPRGCARQLLAGGGGRLQSWLRAQVRLHGWRAGAGVVGGRAVVERGRVARTDMEERAGCVQRRRQMVKISQALASGSPTSFRWGSARRVGCTSSVRGSAATVLAGVGEAWSGGSLSTAKASRASI